MQTTRLADNSFFPILMLNFRRALEIHKMKPGEMHRYVGKRGEDLFRTFITQLCDGRQWFRMVFLGDDAIALDFLVTLEHPTMLNPCCWVSVKATTNTKYSGAGKNRKLLVRVTQKDIRRLKRTVFPTYVVGIDIDSECGFIKRISKDQDKEFVGISALPRHRLNCRSIKKLWSEVEQFWKNQIQVQDKSVF